MPKRIEYDEITPEMLNLPAGSVVKFITPGGVMKINRNTVKELGQGGQISIVGDNSGDDERLLDAYHMSAISLMANYRRDDPMLEFPEPVDAAAADIRYTVIVLEQKPKASSE